MDVGLVLKLLDGGIELLNKFVPSEATRIQNKINDFKKEWDEEMSKGHLRDDANLDRLERELRYIGELFLAAIKGASPQNKP